MFRSGASRSILRSFNTTSTFRATGRQQLRSQLCTVSRRPQLVAAAVKPLGSTTLALARWQSRDERPTVDNIDYKREERIQGKHIKPTPETVSTSSTMTAAADMNAPAGEEAEPQMMAGIKSDLVRRIIPIH